MVIKAWDNFQSIIDKTYLVSTKTQRISPKDREKYFLRATSFERGSFLTKFEILLAGVQLALPLASILGPQNLWDYTKETFTFLKLICTATKDESKPQIDIKDSQHVSVHLGDKHYHFNGPVFEIAEKAIPKYEHNALRAKKQKLNHSVIHFWGYVSLLKNVSIFHKPNYNSDPLWKPSNQGSSP